MNYYCIHCTYGKREDLPQHWYQFANNEQQAISMAVSFLKKTIHCLTGEPFDGMSIPYGRSRLKSGEKIYFSVYDELFSPGEKVVAKLAFRPSLKTDTYTVDIVVSNASVDIVSFRGEYSFLSNFFNTPVVWEGLVFGSVEAAFQAAKCKNEQDRRRFIGIAPNEAKKLGRHVQLRDDWEEVKVNIMYKLVFQKFAYNSNLAEKLCKTGGMLFEGNTWGDSFWGVDTKCGGRNVLGHILTDVRETLLMCVKP